MDPLPHESLTGYLVARRTIAVILRYELLLIGVMTCALRTCSMELLAVWIWNRVADFIAWLIPGKLGKALAILLTWLFFVVFMYLINRETIQNLLG